MLPDEMLELSVVCAGYRSYSGTIDKNRKGRHHRDGALCGNLVKLIDINLDESAIVILRQCVIMRVNILAGFAPSCSELHYYGPSSPPLGGADGGRPGFRITNFYNCPVRATPAGGRVCPREGLLARLPLADALGALRSRRRRCGTPGRA